MTITTTMVTTTVKDQVAGGRVLTHTNECQNTSSRPSPKNRVAPKHDVIISPTQIEIRTTFPRRSLDVILLSKSFWYVCNCSSTHDLCLFFNVKYLSSALWFFSLLFSYCNLLLFLSHTSYLIPRCTYNTCIDVNGNIRNR
jgi:hypothetical protein